MLNKLPNGIAHCIVTSPPYYQQRDYGVEGQIGLESTVGEYVNSLGSVFAACHRVLHPSGTLWLNLGDKIIEGEPAGVPWMVAWGLRRFGWLLRSEIIWAKPNSIPGDVRRRPIVSHETIFLFSKTDDYYLDMEALREEGRDPLETGRRSVWRVPVGRSKDEHFASYPERLVELCVLAGTPRQTCARCRRPYARSAQRERVATRPGNATKYEPGTRANKDGRRHITKVTTLGWHPSCDCGADSLPAVVLDPFLGTGTTAAVAIKLGRRAIGIELNADYVGISQRRLSEASQSTGFGI